MIDPALSSMDGSLSDRALKSRARLAMAKRAFTTRNVDLSQVERLVRTGRKPRAGDLILARVTALGQHARIENVHGRRGRLYVGDEIIVAFGNRYAPDQFEAIVPDELGPCDLVAGGGVAAQVVEKHASMKQATRIEPVGMLIGPDGQPINLDQFVPDIPSPRKRPAHVIAVVGSSMNAGKTTTAAGLVHGMTRAGFRVGAAKVTGTGSGGDLWAMRDAGAIEALDFTDAGHASTFRVEPTRLARVTNHLLARLGDCGVDVAVVEIADGLLQAETAALIEMAPARSWFDGMVFAAADAMGAGFGVQWLARRGWTPLAISGLVSASPLASREAACETGLKIATLAELRDPVAVTRLAFPAPAPSRALRAA